MLKNLEIINELHERLIEKGFKEIIAPTYIAYEYKSIQILCTFTQVFIEYRKSRNPYIFLYDANPINKILSKVDEWMGK